MCVCDDTCTETGFHLSSEGTSLCALAGLTILLAIANQGVHISLQHEYWGGFHLHTCGG
jgi:hypothetical protein